MIPLYLYEHENYKDMNDYDIFMIEIDNSIRPKIKIRCALYTY
ncbi:hypothetical protein [Campylobacter sp. LR264d]|nr:hypothetical protein [Campylobacter sp. LR264d]